MIVMKFGGTSVEDAAAIRRVVEIIADRVKLQPVVVVSAMGKTTRKLLEAAEASAHGDTKTTLAIVNDLKSNHEDQAKGVTTGDTERSLQEVIDKYFDELKKLLEGLAILGEVPPRGLDKILSYGELLSSAILAGALKEHGLHSVLLDSRTFIKTDDRYGGASPIFELTNQLIVGGIEPELKRGAIPVIQGFIGSTRDGATTTIGFEGSDYTATIVGAALNVDDIQIWKDVSGLMTADPALFPLARTVKLCSYAEAGELTYFGAKVLHPKAIYPAARKNIPVHIYNSKLPTAVGTSINSQRHRSANLIKSIAYKRPVTVIKAVADHAADGTNSITPDDFLRSIIDAMRRRRIQPLLTAVSALSLAAAIDSPAIRPGVERDLLEEIATFGTVAAEPERAIVTLVGEELRTDRSLAGRVFSALGDTELGVILHGSSSIAMSFVVGEQDVKAVMTRLHQVFFEHLDPDVFE
jgi:aspartate kinase